MLFTLLITTLPIPTESTLCHFVPDWSYSLEAMDCFVFHSVMQHQAYGPSKHHHIHALEDVVTDHWSVLFVEDLKSNPVEGSWTHHCAKYFGLEGLKLRCNGISLSHITPVSSHHFI